MFAGSVLDFMPSKQRPRVQVCVVIFAMHVEHLAIVSNLLNNNFKKQNTLLF